MQNKSSENSKEKLEKESSEKEIKKTKYGLSKENIIKTVKSLIGEKK